MEFKILFLLMNFLVMKTTAFFRSDSSLHSYFEKNWIYMLDEHDKPVKGYFSTPPSNRADEDIKGDIDFTLFTRSQRSGMRLKKVSDLEKSSFDPQKPTKFITHGWLSSGEADTCVSIRKGYLRSSDSNVIVMNWKNIAGNYYYFTPMRKVPEIAEIYAEFIDEMIETQNVDPKNVHLIGHSLGAQISGLVGNSLKGKKLGRVTGLDPAFPGFDNIVMRNRRISNQSAEFVDVVHSCGGILGLMDAVGHADFYPNGGRMPQPGCTVSDLFEACSHGRSWKYFADSLMHPDKPFYAVRCAEWEDFQEEKCENEEIVMGEWTPTTARGKYYLRTRAEHPYSIGEIKFRNE